LEYIKHRHFTSIQAFAGFGTFWQDSGTNFLSKLIVKPLMNLSVLGKNPTQLPCPRCGAHVDSGASWKAMRSLRRSALACPRCQAPLTKSRKHYWSSLAASGTIVLTHLFPAQSDWRWIFAILGFAASLWLLAKEIDSTHLVIREEARTADSGCNDNQPN